MLSKIYSVMHHLVIDALLITILIGSGLFIYRVHKLTDLSNPASPAAKFNITMDNVDGAIVDVRRLTGKANATMDDVNGTVVDARRLTGQVDRALGEIIGKTNKTMDNVDGAVVDARRLTGQAAATMDHVNGAVVNVHRLTETINRIAQPLHDDIVVAGYSYFRAVTRSKEAAQQVPAAPIAPEEPVVAHEEIAAAAEIPEPVVEDLGANAGQQKGYLGRALESVGRGLGYVMPNHDPDPSL